MGRRNSKTIKSSELAMRRPARCILYLFVEEGEFTPSSLYRPLSLDSATRLEPFVYRSDRQRKNSTPSLASLRHTSSAKTAVDHFFSTGGCDLSVCLIPVEGRFGFNSEAVLCSALEGDEKPFRQSTGLRSLVDSSEQFDFLGVPQLYALCHEDVLLAVYQFILSFIRGHRDRLGSLYLAFEYPTAMRKENCDEWFQKLDNTQAIGFLPGVYSKKYGFLSVIPCFLSALQQHEATVGKHECLSSFELADDIVPLGEASEPLMARQMPVFLNFITSRYASNGMTPIFVWGRLHSKGMQCLHSQRTEQALAEDLSRIAEPYVLEPVKESTLDDLKMDYESYLDRLVSARILLKPRSASNQPAYEIHLSLEEQGLESSIRADVKVTLHSEDQLIPIRAVYGGG